MSVTAGAKVNAPEDVKVERLTPHFVGEVSNIDLSKPIPEATYEKLRNAFHEHSVLVFHNQKITPEEHIEFSRHFGELEIHPQPQYTLPGKPEIFVLSNVEIDGKRMADRGGRRWHSDLSYMAEPCLGSLLHGIECPPEGGNTRFATMYAAYDALSPEMKDRLEGMKAVHSRTYNWEKFYQHRPPLTDEQKARMPDVVHPVIRTHPVTGRKAIYASTSLVSHVIGMEEQAGRDLMTELVEFATQAEFTYDHKWKNGDLVFWDNRCAMHQATDFDEERYRRVMYRTTLKGDRPF